MSEIIHKTVHVHFTDAQRAALADQMADVQSQIEGVEKEKDAARLKFNAALKVLAARMKEYADAVRAGEGDIVIDCMWKPDAAQPLEHLWRLDIMEIVETRQLSRAAAEKEAARQLDLVTPTAAPEGDGLAVAGAAPGTPVMAKVIRLRTGPTPPCPAPVEGAPGGICGADGDQFFNGFCEHHHGALSEVERANIHDGILESRRVARLQASADRRAQQRLEMDQAQEDSERAGLHAQADAAVGAELDALGGPLGCARLDGEESDDGYRYRLKVAIDQAHKGATARAVERGALNALVPLALAGDDVALAKLWGKGVKFVSERANGGEVVRAIVCDAAGRLSIAAAAGAVPPEVRPKPRELTPDLIAQLAQASRGMVDVGNRFETMGSAEIVADLSVTAGKIAAELERIDDAPAPGNEAPTIVRMPGGTFREEIPIDDHAPGNEVEPPPPADEEIDGPQPLYNARRPDGWPLCPGCGADELHSASVPPKERTIVNCMACGWRPPVTPDAPATECPKVRRPVTSEERTAKKATCVTCGKPINIRPVVDAGEWVATLAAHKPAGAQS